MMDQLAAKPIDAIIVAAYLLLSLIVGVVAARLMRSGHAGEEGYYLAGRQVPGWLNGISVAVTAMNADVAPLYCGLTAVIGLPIVWYYLSRFSLAWMIVALLFAVRWRQLGIRTGPEFYHLRFGGSGSRFVRIYTSLFSVAINMIPWIGAGLLGVHKIAGPVFGIEQKRITLAIVLPLLLLYVWISGFAGVLVTDVLQSSVILLASVILLVLVLFDAGGPTALAAAIESTHPEEYSEILSPWPVGGHEVLAPMVVAAWFVVATIGQGGSVDLIGQRMFSCRSAREAAKVPIWAAFGLFTMLLVLTLPVFGMLARRPEIYHAADREQVYGLLLAEYLPTGMLGVAIAALIASVMSTIDSHLNYGAQTLVNDVYRQLFPQARWLSDQHPACLWIGRLTMLVILALAVYVVHAADSLFQIATVIVGMIGTTASFYWGQWWWWRVNLWSWVAAMVGGPIVYLTLGRALNSWDWWQTEVATSTARADFMVMLQAAMAICVTTLLWTLVTMLTRPQPMPVLKAFYLRARPMGAWGPVRRELMLDGVAEASLAPQGILVRGFALAVVGAIWLAATFVGFSCLFVGNYRLGLSLLAGSAAMAAAFWRMFNAYLTRLDAG